FLYLCYICSNTQIARKNCNSTKIIVVAIYQRKLNHTNPMYIVLPSISMKNKRSIRNPRYGELSLDPIFSASIFLLGIYRQSSFCQYCSYMLPSLGFLFPFYMHLFKALGNLICEW
ncbi:hypothetical protein B296_00031525, partial [Ensete ventricosum]